jgi:hypothetical protein
MRAQWAVEAAGHIAAALSVLPGEGRDIRADLTRPDLERVYWRVVFSIGTVPGDRVDEVYEATVVHRMTVVQALDAIGA